MTVGDRPSSKVPSGRLSRFLQLGATASRMAAGGVAETARRAVSKAREGGAHLPHALLTRQNAELLAARLSRLRGAAMKVGQMLSLEGDNMLPPEFARALEILRSSAHRMPEGQVRAVLSRELGDYEGKFGHLDLSPMAAASIGQVHRGTAHDGTELAVKIQYPGVAESIDSDVDNLRSLLALAKLLPGELDVDALTREVKEELHREVDYERELRQIETYREALGERPGMLVPRGVPALSSARVLTMEHASGIEILTWAKDASAEERDRIGTRLLDLLLIELFETRLMQTDPNPANYLYDAPVDQLVLLDFGAVREVPERVSGLYRQAFVALAAADREGVAGVLEGLGVKPKEGSPALDLLLDLSLEAAEAFVPGPYDFGTTNLSERLKVRGRALARHQRDLKSPPPEFIFFQRKLGGTFLLCRQLRARVDCHALLVRHGIIG